jgi:hypothetical protein
VITHEAREAVFYETCPNAFNQMKVYFSFAEFSEPEKCYLLMEDLAGKSTRVDMYHGGNEFVSADDLKVLMASGYENIPSKDVWKRVYEAIAETHAKHWGGKDIPEKL